MPKNKTLTMIKPMAVKNNYIGEILHMINENGFKIKAMRMLHLTKDQAQRFYAVHKNRPFFDELVTFMTSGEIVAVILEKDNAVADFRTLIGATNPEEAEEGTIRKKCGISLQMNAVHGSDSDENAEIEANFFFNQCEQF